MNFKVFYPRQQQILIIKNILYKKTSSRYLSLSKPVTNIASQKFLNIFDRKTKRLQKERAAQAPDANVYDYIKDEIGFRLCDRILDVKRKFQTGLNLGCGRGHVSKNILKESVEELIIADFSQSNLEQAQAPEGVKIKRKILDEEEFSLEENSIDFIISSLSLHWVNDLPRCLGNILHCLKKDGLFIAAMFGTDTLYELRGSLQLAELEREGGVKLHVSPFTEVRDVGSLLTNAGFTMLTIDTDEIVVGYPSLFELMHDLKGMAENNAAINRSLSIKRETLIAASAIYDQLYGKIKKEDGSSYIPATFQIIYMTGWKPDESQPQPLLRGSGEISLKNLGRIDEIIKEERKKKR